MSTHALSEVGGTFACPICRMLNARGARITAAYACSPHNHPSCVALVLSQDWPSKRWKECGAASLDYRGYCPTHQHEHGPDAFGPVESIEDVDVARAFVRELIDLHAPNAGFHLAQLDGLDRHVLEVCVAALLERHRRAVPRVSGGDT